MPLYNLSILYSVISKYLFRADQLTIDKQLLCPSRGKLSAFLIFFWILCLAWGLIVYPTHFNMTMVVFVQQKSRWSC